jgi:hypothetical protein
MEKYDLKKELKRFYSAKEKPELINVPEINYLTYTGRGEPGGVAYTEGLGALYAAAYTLKFASKKKGRDFTVMGLEGLWWWEDPGIVNLEDAPPRDTWNWMSLIAVPDFVTSVMLEDAIPEMIKKKGKTLEKVRFERINEGLCAQILHIGPYSDEPRSQKALHGFIAQQGYRLRGRHHEIYMSDPRKTPPERLRTILRHPIEKA